MQKAIDKLRQIWSEPGLRRRILFVLGALIVFRFMAAIPVPGVNKAALISFFNNNQFFGLLNIFSGGGLSTLSIVMLGAGPYITASIIMQLMTMMSSKLKELYSEDGEAGRRKFTQYTRLLTVPLAFVQAFSYLILLQRESVVSPTLPLFNLIGNAVVIVTGSIIVMWLGELMTEFGIGNGISLIIFAGIIARLPQTLSQLAFTFTSADIPVYIAFLAVALLIIYAVVLITEAERSVPVTYAKQVRGNKIYGGTSTYLPLRLNQAGVIPIIFALSILLFPQLIFTFLSKLAIKGSTGHFVTVASTWVTSVLANQWIYAILYFIFVFIFTYFYTAITFDPDMISENLQKSGAFIPGVRPGQATSAYLSKIITRITLVGATFLGVIAVLPLIVRAISGIQSLAIGGTALLIVVSVVLDLIKKVDAQATMREY
jgi:preprotein translocase subunit SecY